MKLTCEMLRDLLPLYQDGICSQDSRAAVEEHLAVCPGCRDELRLMKKDLSPAASVSELDGARAALRARKRVFFRGAMAVLALLALCLSIYAGWHWFATLPENDLEGLARQASDYLGSGPLQIEKIQHRGNYLAALCLAEDGLRAICIYDQDQVFPDRWYANGGTYWLAPGELSDWNFGSPAREAVLAFGGGDLPAEASHYTFTSAGITYLCPIEQGTVLDLFVIPDGRGSTGTPPELLDADGNPIK